MIVFSHSTKRRLWKPDTQGTVAVELPSKEQLLNVINYQDSVLNVRVGAAELHPKDKFVKKIGRELAQQRLSFINAEVKHIQLENNRLFLMCETVLASKKSYDKYDLKVRMVFSVAKNSESVKLEEAEFRHYYPR